MNKFGEFKHQTWGPKVDLRQSDCEHCSGYGYFFAVGYYDHLGDTGCYPTIERCYCNPEEEPMVSRGTVYITGPMRGQPQYNFPAFYKAQAMLEMWGYRVINPARIDIERGKAHWNQSLQNVILDNKFTIEDALSRDFNEILTRADALVVLGGFESSVGANREIAFGTSIGRKAFKYNEDHPLDIATDTPMDIGINVQCVDMEALEAALKVQAEKTHG